MIIGLCGAKQSGKDTVGAYLVKKHGFEKRAFAYTLKKSFAALFGIPVGVLEELKNDPSVRLEFTRHRLKGFNVPESSLTIRELLQRYGTEAHRDVFGEDFWLDQTLPPGKYFSQNIVITDVRFNNEAERVRLMGGFVVNLIRPLSAKDVHASEEGIEPNIVDYEIENDGTIPSLFGKVDAMMHHFQF